MVQGVWYAGRPPIGPYTDFDAQEFLIWWCGSFDQPGASLACLDLVHRRMVLWSSE